MAKGPAADWLSLTEIAEYHNDATAALRRYFSSDVAETDVRFFDTSPADLKDMLDHRLRETDLRSCLTILASIEAGFRVDYETRCSSKMKDPLSRDFRALHKKYESSVNFEDGLLGLWTKHHPELKRVAGELKGAMKLRHWIAHGRYWQPRLGRRYDFTEVYLLASAIQLQFSLVGMI